MPLSKILRHQRYLESKVTCIDWSLTHGPSNMHPTPRSLPVPLTTHGTLDKVSVVFSAHMHLATLPLGGHHLVILQDSGITPRSTPTSGMLGHCKDPQHFDQP